jgi:hypothetical protein
VADCLLPFSGRLLDVFPVICVQWLDFTSGSAVSLGWTCSAGLCSQ